MSDKWMTIDSAPKDGEPILVATKAGLVTLAWWDKYETAWWELNQECVDSIYALNPTHWQPKPLPPAPKDASHD